MAAEVEMEMAVMDMNQLMKFNREKREVENSMQELQKQRKNLKQSIHEMDEDLKKLTGTINPVENKRNFGEKRSPPVENNKRNFGEKRSPPVENRRLPSTIKRVPRGPLRRDSLDITASDNQPRKLSAEKRRWWTNNELDSGGEEKTTKRPEKPTKRPSLQSSVVVTGKPMEPARPRKEDSTMKKRNKRMFGLLLGTLKQFKQDSSMKTETESKQEEKMIQVEEKVQKEKEDAAVKKKGLLESRRGKRVELEELEFKIEMAELSEELKAHYDQFTDFIQLKSTPCIFYKPAEHNEKTEKLLRDSRRSFRDSFEQRRREISMCTEEDIQTARVPWEDSDENKTSKGKARKDHPESHRLFRYDDERVASSENKDKRRKMSSTRKSVVESKKRDLITVDDDDDNDDNDSITVVEGDERPAKDSHVVVPTKDSHAEDSRVVAPAKDSLDLKNTDINNIISPDGEIVETEEYAYVDWGKFNDDDDNNDVDKKPEKRVRPDILDLNNKNTECIDSENSIDTPAQVDRHSGNDDENEVGSDVDINETVDENIQPNDKEESHIDDDHDDDDDHHETVDPVEHSVDTQNSCKTEDLDNACGLNTEHHTSNERTENNIISNTAPQDGGGLHDQHGQEVHNNIHRPDIIPFNESESKNLFPDIVTGDPVNTQEIDECRNIFTDILPVVNVQQCGSTAADDLFHQNEYTDELLEKVVDEERVILSPSTEVISTPNAVECNRSETSHASNNVHNRTESHVTDITTTEEFPFWPQG